MLFDEYARKTIELFCMQINTNEQFGYQVRIMQPASPSVACNQQLA